MEKKKQMSYVYGLPWWLRIQAKESTCNAGNLGLIPGLGRSPGEGKGYLLQYSGLENFMDCIVHGVPKNLKHQATFTFRIASQVAQLVKHPTTIQETWVWSPGWEDPLEKGMATHSSILVWRISWTVWPMGLQRVGHDWVTVTFTIKFWRVYV